MPFSDAEIRRQLRLGEDGAWEFKQIEFKGNRPVSPGRSDLADEIAAFANADGGVLLCGVTDTGDVQGMSRGQMDELEPLLVEICTDTIKPPVRPVILRRELEEGKPFLVVEVPQGHARHDSPGGSFHRVGSSKRRMTSDERLRLAQRRGQARESPGARASGRRSHTNRPGCLRRSSAPFVRRRASFARRRVPARPRGDDPRPCRL